MSKPNEHVLQPRGLSRPNTIAIALCIVGAAGSAAFGNPRGAVVLVLIAVGGAVSVLLARRPDASDALRIDALEYRDERDVRLAREGLASTGGVALVLVLTEGVAATFIASFVPPLVSLVVTVVASAQMFVLFAVWGVANRRAVHRG